MDVELHPNTRQAVRITTKSICPFMVIANFGEQALELPGGNFQGLAVLGGQGLLGLKSGALAEVGNGTL